jgi:transposase
MWKKATKIELSQEQKSELERWIRAHTTPQSVVMRAKIILLANGGLANNAISKELKVHRSTVIEWRKRFQKDGSKVLTEVKEGRGRKSSIGIDKVKQIIEATTQTKPKGATHWSCRTMAKAQGVSKDTVHRIWDANGLRPHKIKSFKLSNDPNFLAKITDVVGLYMNPPDKAIVLCVDEKSQIQALDRTQPGLPLKKGRCGTMTHDYKRNGTTTLFAALNTLEGKVIGECYPKHRHQEFLKFLRILDKEFPKELSLHLVLDNYGTHKKKEVIEWLEKHPRFKLHFTPTSSSWLNLVERWFKELTDKRIRRGVFRSVSELIASIEEFLEVNNENPKPFIWKASVESILTKISNCRAILETLH